MAAVLIWTGNYDRLEPRFAKLTKMGFVRSGKLSGDLSAKVYPVGQRTVQIKPELVSKALADVIKNEKIQKIRYHKYGIFDGKRQVCPGP